MNPTSMPEPSPSSDVALGGSPSQAGADAEGALDNEESIEAYMTRLLERTRRKVNDAISTPAKAEAVAPPPAAVADVTPSPTNVAEPQPVVESPAPRQPLPRSPQETLHLSTWRDLANHSARLAISAHVRREVARSAHRMLAASALAILAAFILFEMPANLAFLRVAGLIAAAAAMILGVRYLLLSFRLTNTADAPATSGAQATAETSASGDNASGSTPPQTING